MQFLVYSLWEQESQGGWGRVFEPPAYWRDWGLEDSTRPHLTRLRAAGITTSANSRLSLRERTVLSRSERQHLFFPRS